MTALKLRKPAGLFALVLSLVGTTTFAQDAKPAEAPAAAPAAAPAPVGDKLINVRMSTNFGDMIIELNNEKAPISVANFLKYTDAGFYNGTLFHRVMPNFMIQGGGYGIGLIEKKTEAPIHNEWGNGLKNEKYAIAMARLMAPDTATAQFFINTVNNPRLDAEDVQTAQMLGGAGYAVFGKVIAGQGVVDAIKAVPTRNEMSLGGEPTPVEPIAIEKVERVPALELEAAKKEADASVEKGKAELLKRNQAKQNIENAAKKRFEDLGKALGTPDEQFTKAMDWLKSQGVDVSKGQKFESGLWMVETKPGEGATPEPTDVIRAHYTGWIVNGNKFQSSLDTGTPLEYRLNQLVPGWIEGFGKMKTGGKAYLVVPAPIAYGEIGRPPLIPPNATLIFDVELLEVVGK